jgi:hypothetical protein
VLKDKANKLDVAQTIISGEQTADSYKINLYNGVTGSSTVANIPSYTNMGFDSIEAVDGVFLADGNLVYDILDYVDENKGYTKSEID